MIDYRDYSPFKIMMKILEELFFSVKVYIGYTGLRGTCTDLFVE